jgi:mRNA interferase HicA
MSASPDQGGSEFLRKVTELGKTKGLNVTFVPHRGKGSHGTFHYGDRFTVVRNPKDELKKGTLHAMLKQLGIDPKEF